MLATLLTETSTQEVFPKKFVKFLRTPILKNVCERLIQLYSLKILLIDGDVYKKTTTFDAYNLMRNAHIIFRAFQ